jgi:hypothetical protein
MPAGLRAIATILLTALPLAARAEGVNFTVPEHYLVAPPGPNPALPPVYRVWDRAIDGARHSLVVSATSTTYKLATLVDAVVSLANARHATGVSRTDAPPLCGEPSAQVQYGFSGQLSFVFRYTIVRGRLLTASYGRPEGSAADPTALAALDTLCTGVHQPGSLPGWTQVTPYPPNGNAWRASGNSRSLLAQIASIATPGRDLLTQRLDADGTTTADRKDTCGSITIRRMTANLADGRIRETAAGTVNGYDYVVAYARLASEAADPGAIRTLTSFCAATGPAPTPPAI